MSQPLQLSVGVQDVVNNQYLFSDHYLLNLLPRDPRWQGDLGRAGAFAGEASQNLPEQDYLFQAMIYGSLADTYRQHARWQEPRVCYLEMLDCVDALTDREQEMLELLSAGLTNREVAGQLVISPLPVKTHAGNIYGKLGVSSRTEAAARAGELELLK